MREAGVEDVKDCFFVGMVLNLKPIIEIKKNLLRLTNCYVCMFKDDSYTNARGAHDYGWTTVHLIEPGEPLPAQPACKYQIRKLEELAELFPHFFKAKSEVGAVAEAT